MTQGRYAIVLAAGAGSRFGGAKLTASWRAEPLVRWSVRAALSTRVEAVMLVTGAGAGEVSAAVMGLDDTRLRIVEAADWAEGLSSSLRIGLEALPSDAEAVAIFLGDMPEVDSRMADRLLDAVIAGAPAARARSPLGPAHPTAFARRMFAALQGVTGDQGGKSVLAALGEAVVTLETDDPGAVFDIDRREDLERGPRLSN